MKNSNVLYLLLFFLVVINLISTYGVELSYVERIITGIPITIVFVGAYIVDTIESLKDKK